MSRSATPTAPSRRSVARAALALLPLALVGRRVVAQDRAGRADEAEARRWHDAALRQRERAMSWGDQPYGAVLVLDGQLVGEGPSRVVQRGDITAHAEREAIRDALRRLGPSGARGAVLYSTSRPCAACEQAAAEAGVARMVFGEALTDAGAPRAAAR